MLQTRPCNIITSDKDQRVGGCNFINVLAGGDITSQAWYETVCDNMHQCNNDVVCAAECTADSPCCLAVVKVAVTGGCHDDVMSALGRHNTTHDALHQQQRRTHWQFCTILSRASSWQERTNQPVLE